MLRGRWFEVSAALGIVSLLAAIVPACDAGGDGRVRDSGDGSIGSAATEAGNSAASSGSGGSKSSEAGAIVVDSGNGGSGGFDPDASCAGETHEAELVPLDLFIMLDISASMTQLTSAGTPKWDEVKEALGTFLRDPLSARLGVGIQFFPQTAAGVPAECTNHQQCGQWGPCFITVCQNSAQGFVPCSQNQDCPGTTGPCVPLGTCGQLLCAPAGTACANLQPCASVQVSTCTRGSCALSMYERAAVPIAALPGNARLLMAAIDAQVLRGGTPTGPSLEGALTYAKTFSEQNTEHVTAVVYATDGLPTECAPQDISSISQIAASAYAATPSVRTFVVGVFAPSESAAPSNLNAIAAAGGTQTAFMIDTTKSVAQQLIAALNKIRASVLACEFLLPAPLDGGELDFDKVNVQVTDIRAAPTPLYYVSDPSQCDPVNGGWHYDVDPKSGGRPTKIIVCPSTCAVFKQSIGMKVDLRLGCQTRVKPPR